MTLDGAVLAGRLAAEALMADTGIMRRPNGTSELDPVTDQETEVLDDLFTTKCKIQARNLQAAHAEVGGRTAVTVRMELHLPVNVPDVQTGDLFEVTAVGSLTDIQLLGRSFRVVAPVGKSYATARRLEVEEVVS